MTSGGDLTTHCSRCQLTHGKLGQWDDNCLIDDHCCMARATVGTQAEHIARSHCTERYVQILEEKVRTVINADRTGLAAGLNHVQAIVRGYWWIAEGTWGSYSYEEHTTETLQREVRCLIEGVLSTCDRSLKQSGARATEAVRMHERLLPGHCALCGKHADHEPGRGCLIVQDSLWLFESSQDSLSDRRIVLSVKPLITGRVDGLVGGGDWKDREGEFLARHTYICGPGETPP